MGRSVAGVQEEDLRRNVGDGKKYIAHALYVVVSLRAMQAIDFGYLVEKGFKFHHYRAPGHGATMPEPTLDEEGKPILHKNDTFLETVNDEGTAEFVYYCWPGDPAGDMVPNYSTAIEGATGICFSPDGEKVLLVWERGAWSSSGGAVNETECKITALKREVRVPLQLLHPSLHLP